MRILSAFAAAALATAALTLGLSAAAVVGLPAPQAAAATAADDAAVTLQIAPEAAGVLRPGDDLTVSVSVKNTTDDEVEAGKVRIYLDRRAFATRDAIASWLNPDSVNSNDFLGTLLTDVDMPAVAPGATQTVASVTVPSSRVALGGGWGARALGARLVVDGSQVAQARNSVVWYPGDSFQPTRVSMAVPITVPETETGVLDATALSSYTSTGGILRRELDTVAGKPIALGVDPMILASIRLLGSDAPEPAVAWMNDLFAAGNPLFSLAYADSDISGLSQAGANPLPSPIAFDQLIDSSRFAAGSTAQPTTPATDTESTPPTDGASGDAEDPNAGGAGQDAPSAPATNPAAPALPTTQSLLALPTGLPNLAWPQSDTVVARDLPVFAASGYAAAILSSSNVKGATGSTENAVTTIDGVTSVVSDDALSRLIARAASAPDDATWKSTVAQLSASASTIAYERPSDARTILVTLDRDWITDSARLAETVDTFDSLPWTTPASLSDALAATPSTSSVSDKAEPEARLASLRSLATAYGQVRDFATALSEPQQVTAPSALTTLAISSNAWRSNEAGFTTEVSEAVTEAAKQTATVSIVQGSDFRIVSDRTSLRVYLQNMTNSVATVNLAVAPSNPSLKVEKNPILVEIQPQSQTRVSVPVQSVANGTVNIRMTLASTTGVAISAPATVAIDVQAGWETALTWTFGIAVALIFAGGIYRTVRRRLHPKSADDDSAAKGTT
ncbi:DUF6049 family protein [Frigoribacterium sp. 2-23]|uniref:DUF6049 family protein n=1 Tax=Frigoribacterium sp. 2-23 TaxID=3415006 RepID=UPI003C6ED4EF